MIKVAGIRFKPAGKIYDFDCGAFVLSIGDNVIVETEQGLGLGVITVAPSFLKKEDIKTPLKQVFRIATEEDFQHREKNKALEQKAFDFCQESIKILDLKMNLFSR